MFHWILFKKVQLAHLMFNKNMTHTIRILGLDPGLQRTGYGVIDVSGNHLQYVTHGVVQTDTALDLSKRLFTLFEELSKVIEAFEPNEAAVEETFVNTNATTTLKLGMARGIVLMVPSKYDLIVGEYSANRVKKAVVGVGHADKSQVSMMVQRLLTGCGVVTADAADALAVAICHAHFRKISTLLKVG